MAVLKIKNEITKEWEDVITIKGDKGDKPSHEIEGTKIRFQNPDGTWGSWIELEVLTAVQIPTRDGGNVQTKLDNSFALGVDTDGYPQVQTENGFVRKDEIDLDEIRYTGIYYCKDCTNRPVANNGWLEVFGGLSNIKQVYHLLGTTTQTTFARTFTNGTWTEWVLIFGEMQIYYTSGEGVGTGGSLTMSLPITMFGKVKLYYNGQTSIPEGVVNKTNRNIRAALTDVTNSIGSVNIFGSVLTWSQATPTVLNVGRSNISAIPSTGTTTGVATTITRVIGLP